MATEIRDLRAGIGPFRLKASDWTILRRHVSTFCINDGCEIYFAITGTEEEGKIETGDLVMLPVRNLLDPELVGLLSKIQGLLAFGYVRREDSTDAKDSDDILAAMIAKKLHRSVYYIIMNPRLEYNVYKTSPAIVRGILQPVDEE